MKLKDFLAQFEGLNPEIEVYYQNYGHNKSAESLDLRGSFHKIGFISNHSSEYLFYSDQKSEDFDIEVLILI
jgi:hypothetical protein